MIRGNSWFMIWGKNPIVTEHLYLNQFCTQKWMPQWKPINHTFHRDLGTKTNKKQPASILCMFHLAISAAVVPAGKRVGDAHQCSFVSCKIWILHMQLLNVRTRNLFKKTWGESSPRKTEAARNTPQNNLWLNCFQFVWRSPLSGDILELISAISHPQSFDVWSRFPRSFSERNFL